MNKIRSTSLILLITHSCVIGALLPSVTAAQGAGFFPANGSGWFSRQAVSPPPLGSPLRPLAGLPALFSVHVLILIGLGASLPSVSQGQTTSQSPSSASATRPTITSERRTHDWEEWRRFIDFLNGKGRKFLNRVPEHYDTHALGDLCRKTYDAMNPQQLSEVPLFLGDVFERAPLLLVRHFRNESFFYTLLEFSQTDPGLKGPKLRLLVGYIQHALQDARPGETSGSLSQDPQLWKQKLLSGVQNNDPSVFPSFAAYLDGQGSRQPAKDWILWFALDYHLRDALETAVQSPDDAISGAAARILSELPLTAAQADAMVGPILRRRFGRLPAQREVMNGWQRLLGHLVLNIEAWPRALGNAQAPENRRWIEGAFGILAGYLQDGGRNEPVLERVVDGVIQMCGTLSRAGYPAGPAALRDLKAALDHFSTVAALGGNNAKVMKARARLIRDIIDRQSSIRPSKRSDVSNPSSPNSRRTYRSA